MSSNQDRQGYNNYIKSAEWYAIRSRRIAKAGDRCEWLEDDYYHKYSKRCSMTYLLSCHHLHYGTFGAERDEDLQVLCWFHHMLTHLQERGCGRCGDSLNSEDLENYIADAVRDHGYPSDKIFQLWLPRGETAVEPAYVPTWTQLPSLDELRDCVPNLCDYCNHILEKDD